MDKKNYYLTGGKTTVDLKNTQLELLKIKTMLGKTKINNIQYFSDLYDDIFENIKPVTQFVENLSQGEPKDNLLFSSADDITKLINLYDFNEVQFKYKKLGKIMPPIQFNKIKLDSLVIDDKLDDRTRQNIKDSKKTLSIDLKPITIPSYTNPSKKTNPEISFKPKDLTLATWDESELPHHKLKFNLKPIDASELSKPELSKDFSVELETLDAFIQEKEALLEVPLESPTLEANKLILEEKIAELEEFIQILISPLDISIIETAISTLEIKPVDETDSELFNERYNGFLQLLPTENLPIEYETPFKSQTINLNGEDLVLDNDPFKLEGGNLESYLEKVKDFLNPKTKKSSKSINLLKANLIENINKFNLFYIQYNYFLLYLNNKFIKYSDNYYFYPVLKLNTLLILYNIIKEQFDIINNPKENIFSDTITDEDEKIKRKKMYFKHYYIIYILYYFHKLLIEKVIKHFTGTDIKVEDYNLTTSTIFTEEYKINLINSTNSNNLKKLIILFTFYMF
jgi:hypothetical protein